MCSSEAISANAILVWIAFGLFFGLGFGLTFNLIGIPYRRWA